MESQDQDRQSDAAKDKTMRNMCPPEGWLQIEDRWQPLKIVEQVPLMVAVNRS